MTARTRVVIADDHQLVRAGLRRLLDSFDDFEVVGEAGNGIALLELAHSRASNPGWSWSTYRCRSSTVWMPRPG